MGKGVLGCPHSFILAIPVSVTLATELQAAAPAEKETAFYRLFYQLPQSWKSIPYEKFFIFHISISWQFSSSPGRCSRLPGA